MKDLKLNQISSRQLDEKEMNQISGGVPGGQDPSNNSNTTVVYSGYVWDPKCYCGIPTCGCACAYANQGGSSTADNASANEASKLFSPKTKLPPVNYNALPWG